MITEQDLTEAIAECQGVRNPNMAVCIKLAALYTIRNEMFGKPIDAPLYSFSAGVAPYNSKSEFWHKVQNKDLNEIMPVLDDLMDTISVLNPKLYDAVMTKL